MSLRFPTAAVMAALLAFGSVLIAAPATAHATLVSSNPADGAALKKEPTSITLTFNENVATPAQLLVTAPDGTKLADQTPSIDGTDIRQTIDASGQSGTYRVAYRVVSADGHPVTGELSYDVAAGERTATDAQSDNGSFVERHRIHLILGGIAVVVAAVLLCWPWIRRRV